jgi:hypothetical protein
VQKNLLEHELFKRTEMGISGVKITCILGKRAVRLTGKGTVSELYPAIFWY